MNIAGIVDTLIVGPVQGVFLLVSLGILALKLWAVIDAATRPAAAFVAAGKQSKTIWLVITGLAVLFNGLSIFGIAALIASIVYLVDVRPAVREVRRGGSAGPYGPW